MMKQKTLKQGHVGVYHLAEIFSVEALKFKKALPYTKFDSLTLSGSLHLAHPATLPNITQLWGLQPPESMKIY